MKINKNLHNNLLKIDAFHTSKTFFYKCKCLLSKQLTNISKTKFKEIIIKSRFSKLKLFKKHHMLKTLKFQALLDLLKGKKCFSYKLLINYVKKTSTKFLIYITSLYTKFLTFIISNYRKFLITWVLNPFVRLLIVSIYGISISTILCFYNILNADDNTSLINDSACIIDTNKTTKETTIIMENGTTFTMHKKSRLDYVMTNANAPGYWTEEEIVGDKEIFTMTKHVPILPEVDHGFRASLERIKTRWTQFEIFQESRSQINDKISSSCYNKTSNPNQGTVTNTITDTTIEDMQSLIDTGLFDPVNTPTYEPIPLSIPAYEEFAVELENIAFLNHIRDLDIWDKAEAIFRSLYTKIGNTINESGYTEEDEDEIKEIIYQILSKHFTYNVWIAKNKEEWSSPESLFKYIIELNHEQYAFNDLFSESEKVIMQHINAQIHILCACNITQSDPIAVIENYSLYNKIFDQMS